MRFLTPSGFGMTIQRVIYLARHDGTYRLVGTVKPRYNINIHYCHSEHEVRGISIVSTKNHVNLVRLVYIFCIFAAIFGADEAQ